MPGILGALGFTVPPAFKECGFMFAAVEAVCPHLPKPVSYDDGGVDCAYPYVARCAALVESKTFRAECDSLAAEFKVAPDQLYACALQRYSAEPYANRALLYVEYLQHGYNNLLLPDATRKRIADVMNGVTKEKLTDIRCPTPPTSASPTS